MDLTVWTSTTIHGRPIFDPALERWSISLKKETKCSGNGKTTEKTNNSEMIIETIYPRHIILATGQAGAPRIPDFPGLEKFKGEIMHSSAFSGSPRYSGKNVIVVGCGNSAHDIAMELYEQEAGRVTLVQRSSTYVMSRDFGVKKVFCGLHDEDGLPTDDADLFNASFPFLSAIPIRRHLTSEVAKHDREMLASLEAVGFKVDYGYEGTGFMLKYLLASGGCYIDVGCCKLIADCKIHLKHGSVKEFVEDGIIFEDSTKLEAELVVLATGFLSMRETARSIFGDEVADRIQDVWGLADDGEISGMWQRITLSDLY